MQQYMICNQKKLENKKNKSIIFRDESKYLYIIIRLGDIYAQNSPTELTGCCQNEDNWQEL